MGTLHLAVNVLLSHWGYTRGLVACSAGLLLWTLAPHDHVTYYQARGLSGHTSPCGECVCFNLKNSASPKVGEDYLPFSWMDSKWAHLVHYEEIFDFELELLSSF